MEEDNNITLWKYIKQHWKMLLLILLFPIVINALSFIPNFHIFDKPNYWTEVWAEYGGALLSAGIALVILYKQQKQNEKVNEAILKQNHEENEANRKQNELQNKLNLNLQINALKYQQKYNWYFELKHSLTDLIIACDLNIIKSFINNLDNYYRLTDIDEIHKAESEIKKSIDNYFFKINSYVSSFVCLLNTGEKEELDDKLERLHKNLCYYYNILNNLEELMVIFKNPVINKISKKDIKEQLDDILEKEEKKFEKLDEHKRLINETILKKYLEQYNYDFYGNDLKIFKSMFEDFKKNVESMGNIIVYILEYEREKIDKLLDVEEIKKNLNAN